MSRIKGFIKWTDIALSLREVFGEINGALKDHEKEFISLHNQNMLLLQQLEFQKQMIDDLKERISRLEDRQEVIVSHPSLDGLRQKMLRRDVD